MMFLLFIKGFFMENLKRELRQEAEEKYEKIYPSGRKENLEDCYTESGGKLFFWFNLENQTTKVLAREIHN